MRLSGDRLRGHELEDLGDIASFWANQASSIGLEPTAPSMNDPLRDYRAPAAVDGSHDEGAEARRARRRSECRHGDRHPSRPASSKIGSSQRKVRTPAPGPPRSGPSAPMRRADPGVPPGAGSLSSAFRHCPSSLKQRPSNREAPTPPEIDRRGHPQQARRMDALAVDPGFERLRLGGDLMQRLEKRRVPVR